MLYTKVKQALFSFLYDVTSDYPGIFFRVILIPDTEYLLLLLLYILCEKEGVLFHLDRYSLCVYGGGSKRRKKTFIRRTSRSLA